jgi:hypothetical protein
LIDVHFPLRQDYTTPHETLSPGPPPMATFITGLDVSFGAALLSTSLSKVVGKDGNPVDIQPLSDKGGSAVNLWIGTGTADTAEHGILDVTVLQGDEPVPAGFKKVTRDLSAGATTVKSFLAYRLGAPSATEKVLVGLAILAPGEECGESGVHGRAACRGVEGTVA